MRWWKEQILILRKDFWAFFGRRTNVKRRGITALRNKTGGSDGLVGELLKYGGSELLKE